MGSEEIRVEQSAAAQALRCFRLPAYRTIFANGGVTPIKASARIAEQLGRGGRLVMMRSGRGIGSAWIPIEVALAVQEEPPNLRF